MEELKKKIAASATSAKPAEIPVENAAEAKTKAKAKVGESESKTKAKAPSNSKRGPQLNDILKIESTDDIPEDLLVKMWSYHHSTKEAYVSGSLTTDTFKIFRERTKACKMVRLLRLLGPLFVNPEAISFNLALVCDPHSEAWRIRDLCYGGNPEAGGLRVPD